MYIRHGRRGTASNSAIKFESVAVVLWQKALKDER